MSIVAEKWMNASLLAGSLIALAGPGRWPAQGADRVVQAMVGLAGALHVPQWPTAVLLRAHRPQVRSVLVCRPHRAVGVCGPHELHRLLVDVLSEQVLPLGRIRDGHRRSLLLNRQVIAIHGIGQ
ncbi:hypothetical protein ACWCQZ_46980 [Streptomyces sp. NPDC002285]